MSMQIKCVSNTMIHLRQVFQNCPNGLGLVVDCRSYLHGRVVYLGDVGAVDTVEIAQLSIDKAKEG